MFCLPCCASSKGVTARRYWVVWSIAQPLTLMVIYTVIFGQLMQSRLPSHGQTPFAFSIYLCAGVVFWGFHAEITTRMASVFIDQANLMKRLRFPESVCRPSLQDQPASTC